jgi:hypothetical protein
MSEKTIHVRSRRSRYQRRRRQPTSNTYVACKEVLNTMLLKHANVKTVEEFRLALNKIANNKKVWNTIDVAIKELAKAQLMIEEIY